MPYYLIIINLTNGKVVKGVKENQNIKIDQVFRIYFAEAEKHFRGSQIKEFDCFMISRQSNIYKEWMKKRQIKSGMVDNPFLDDIEDIGTPPISRKQAYKNNPNTITLGEIRKG